MPDLREATMRQEYTSGYSGAIRSRILQEMAWWLFVISIGGVSSLVLGLVALVFLAGEFR